MDVSLVLTHRCNLACSYCYAGEHHRAAVDDVTLERAVALLWSDGAKAAQLSFFGGEPFLQFERMQRAVALARAAEAAEPGRRLILQCTTNGTLLGPREVAFVHAQRMRVAVSLDGVREAHELNRPRAGGASSFSSAYRGLRALIDASCVPEVLMVITPATALFTFRSVRWLWDEGVERVRANLDLRATWSPEFRRDLNDELVALGRELLHRRLHGRPVTFEPFVNNRASLALGPPNGQSPLGAPPGGCGDAGARARVVVGTSGNLYPCSPMVGEDRARGPEAAVRLGHLDDGVEAILAKVRAEGVSCGTGGGACACAAWLETGDRTTPGANGRWFAKLCSDVGAAVAAGLIEATQRRVPQRPAFDAHVDGLASRARRDALIGLAVGASGLALASAGLVQIRKYVAPTPAKLTPRGPIAFQGELSIPMPDPQEAKRLRQPAARAREPETEPEHNVEGGVSDVFEPEAVVPPPPPPPEPPPRRHDVDVDGGMVVRPDPTSAADR